MEKTRVDLILERNKYTFRDGLVDIEMRDWGQWKIDNVPGKKLCRIVVKAPQKGVTVDFIPSHSFCEQFVDSMLEAEHANDAFIFENPTIGDTRPMQFEDKLKRLARVLEKWQDRKLSPQLKLKPKEVEMPSNNIQLPNNAHPPYRLTDGAVVPSVTQVLGILNKGGLNHWAWECGRQGIDYRDVRDEAARVGTIAHYLIACHLKGEKADTSEYYPDMVDKAEASLAKYLAWEKENPLTPVIIETPFISEELRFGGTPDLLADIDDEFVLIDFKTGGGIYESHFYQVAAYRKLLEEQGWPVARAWILRISPHENDEAEQAAAVDLNRHWQIFQYVLAIWQLRGGEGE